MNTPEQNPELENLDHSDEEITETPNVPDTTKPEPATKDDIQTIVRDCFADLKSNDEAPPDLLEKADPLSGYNPQFARDIRQLLDDQAKAIHAEYSPLLAANLANLAVDRVAADSPPQTKDYIRKMVSRMDSHVAKAMISDPDGLEMLETLVLGLNAKSSTVKIPRTSEPNTFQDEGDFEPSGLQAFMRAFGVDRKRASELYRQAQREHK